MIRTLSACLAGWLLAGTALAADLPYDETRDARADLAQGLARAKDTGRKVLLVFGANWCPDCRELDRAMHGKSAALIEEKFVVVKVDVGNFNRNMDLSAEYGTPTKKGIPAAVILAADNTVVYATRGGELSNARRMGDTGVHDFFADVIAKNK